MEKLARLYGGKQLNVIGISTDDYRELAVGFLQKSKTSFPNFIDRHLELENMLGADHLPLTLLVDEQGRVRHKLYGENDWSSPKSLKLIEKTLRIKLPAATKP